MIKQKDSDENIISLLIKAVNVIRDTQIASTASLQMRLKINYTTALKIMETLEDMGLVGQADGVNPRQIYF